MMALDHVTSSRVQHSSCLIPSLSRYVSNVDNYQCHTLWWSPLLPCVRPSMSAVSRDHSRPIRVSVTTCLMGASSEQETGGKLINGHCLEIFCPWKNKQHLTQKRMKLEISFSFDFKHWSNDNDNSKKHLSNHFNFEICDWQTYYGTEGHRQL